MYSRDDEISGAGHGAAESGGRRRIGGGVRKDDIDTYHGRLGLSGVSYRFSDFPSVAVGSVYDKKSVIYDRTVVALGGIKYIGDGDVIKLFFDGIERRYAR